jgi:hypothetical protein
MTRTTPPRPFDLAAVFPEMAALARTAYRLHPCPGEPTVQDSSVGGPLLWPADEPWPEYELTHVPYEPLTTLADLHRLRAVVAQSHARPRRPGEDPLTEDEREAINRHRPAIAPESLPAGPQPLIPLLQLYARDVPSLRFPPGTDLLQVLWVPSPVVEGCTPAVQLRWRRSSELLDVLLAPPEPAHVEYSDLVPEPCVLHPEAVREFPSSDGLDRELVARLDAWCKQRSVDYWNDLSVAPGFKAGGWPAHFTFRDPPEQDSDELCCGECGGPVEVLLSVTGSEWDRASVGWRPVECGEAAGTSPRAERNLSEPTAMTIARGYTLQFYNCVGTPSHLPRTIMQ